MKITAYLEGKRGADGGILRGLGALLVWVTQDVDLALSTPSSRTGAFGCRDGINPQAKIVGVVGLG